MDLVKREERLITELINIYSSTSLQKELIVIAQKVVKVLQKLLIEKGKEFDLISKNSVREIKYFSVVYRIKEAQSLKEKFYRSNFLHTFFGNHNFKNISEVKKERNKVKDSFKKCDDIIGIKILTDLNEDCRKVLSLIKNNEKLLKSKSIVFNKKELALQPSLMKNGLEIYKIKGVFRRKYNFELQIKSKIVSAWGDMEHSIFYKDYFVSPVRETTEASMRHIGKLLFQIDNFLVSVRNANSDYKQNSRVISFLTWFDTNYSEKISDKIGKVGFKIDNISEALFFIYYELNKNIKIRELYFSHFENRVRDINLLNYIKIRNSSYDLKIFESIVFSWLWTPSQVTNSNIENKLKKYFDLIIKFISFSLKSRFRALDEDKLSIDIKNYFSEVSKYYPSSKIIVSANDYIDHFKFMSFIKSELEFIDISKLDLIFFNKRMEGNCEAQISEMRFNDDELKKLREILKNIEYAIKLKEKPEFRTELTFIQDLINYLNK